MSWNCFKDCILLLVFSLVHIRCLVKVRFIPTSHYVSFQIPFIIPTTPDSHFLFVASSPYYSKYLLHYGELALECNLHIGFFPVRLLILSSLFTTFSSPITPVWVSSVCSSLFLSLHLIQGADKPQDLPRGDAASALPFGFALLLPFLSLSSLDRPQGPGRYRDPCLSSLELGSTFPRLSQPVDGDTGFSLILSPSMETSLS